MISFWLELASRFKTGGGGGLKWFEERPQGAKEAPEVEETFEEEISLEEDEKVIMKAGFTGISTSGVKYCSSEKCGDERSIKSLSAGTDSPKLDGYPSISESDPTRETARSSDSATSEEINRREWKLKWKTSTCHVKERDKNLCTRVNASYQKGKLKDRCGCTFVKASFWSETFIFSFTSTKGSKW